MNDWWKADDVITCSRCSGRAHDAVKSGRKGTLLLCCYCGVGEWTRRAPPPLKKTAPSGTGDYVFDEGRYEGKTILEVMSQEGGNEYLDYICENGGKHAGPVRKHRSAAG